MKFNLAPWREDMLEERPFYGLRRELDRMVDELDRVFDMPVSWRRERHFTPMVDIKEMDDAFVLTAELPGMKPEDVEVTLQKNVLTICGEKETKKEEDKENYYRMERSYGSFTRTVPLPADVVDDDNVDATFADGVLTIKLPKLPEAQTVAKQIPVTAVS